MFKFSVKHITLIRIYASLVLLTIGLFANAQKDLRLANQFYELGAYSRSIPYYSNYLNDYADDRAFVKRGWSYYQCNKLDSALLDFENARLLYNDDAEVEYYTAKTYQQKMDFEMAIFYFKKYLARKLKNDKIRASVTNEIKRCAQGLNLQYSFTDNYVENLGSAFNSAADEQKIIQSPNNAERYYFSRRQNSDGPAQVFYHISNESNKDRSESFVPENALFDQSIVDIGQDGKYLFLERFDSGKNKSFLYIDLFVPGDLPLTNLYVFDGPVYYENGDRDLSIINDSTYLFSSNKTGGLGGYDLYVTGKRNGFWFEPINLGSSVNSSFDEITPSYSADHKILFFSSDRLESVGGFDVFQSNFDSESDDWTAAKNLGFPINSAGDELGFKMTNDGNTAYFSSDRKSDSAGGFDLYRSFFKIAFGLQNSILAELDFLINQPLKKLSRAKQQIPVELDPEEIAESTTFDEPEQDQPAGAFEDQIQKNFESWINANLNIFNKDVKSGEIRSIPSLFYTVDSFILKRPVNQKIIENILTFLKNNPDYFIELTSHCHASGTKLEDLNLAMQVLAPMKNYFMENEIEHQRIILLCGGSYFPIAKSEVNQQLQKLSEKYNNRIEIKLYSSNTQKSIFQSQTDVVPHLKNGSWILYNSLASGLSYKLKVVELTELRNAPYLNHIPECLVVKDDLNKKYIVYSGIYRKYKNALESKKQLAAQSQVPTEIIPFINGVPVDSKKALEEADNYIDLINYLESIK